MKKIFLFILMMFIFCGVANAETFYLWRQRTHATDCTSLTDGKDRDLCFEQDDNTLYVCNSDDGTCNTPSEWKQVTGGNTEATYILEDGVAEGNSTESSIYFNFTDGLEVTTSGQNFTIAGEDASTTNKGIAQFSSSHFTTSSGVVSLLTDGIDDTLLDFGTSSGQISTDDIPQGSTNTYNPFGSLIGITEIDASGSAGSTTYLRGDGTWATPTGSGDITSVGSTASGDALVDGVNTILTWEGSTTDDYETTLSVVDPTGDRSILLPNESGTILTNATSFAGDVSGTSGAIVITDDSHSHTTTTLPSNVSYLGANISLSSEVTGTLPYTNGGTGITSWTSGQIPIGSTGIGLVAATLTEGEGIDVTNGAGSITLAGEDASTSNKGIASFSSSDFSTSSGAVSILSTLTRDTEWDTISEIETATGVNILVSTELDTLAELNSLIGDGNVVSQATYINTTSPLSGGGDLSTSRTLTIATANASTTGAISSTDWTTFNSKADYSFGANNFNGTGNFVTTGNIITPVLNVTGGDTSRLTFAGGGFIDGNTTNTLIFNATTIAMQGAMNVTGGTGSRATFSGGGYIDGNTTNRLQLVSTNVDVDGILGILESGASPTYHTFIQGGNQTANVTYRLPSAIGTANQILTLSNATTGQLSWANSTAAGAQPGGVAGNIQYAVNNTTLGGFGSFNSTSNATTLPGQLSISGTTGGSIYMQSANTTGVYSTFTTGNFSSNITYTLPVQSPQFVNQTLVATAVNTTAGTASLGWVNQTGGGTSTLTSAHIFVGNATNVSTDVALSGDATLSNTGALTIADNAVDGTDIALASQAAGDIMYYNGTDWIRLAEGTTDQVLASNATTHTPYWKDDATTAGSGGAPTNATYITQTANGDLSAEQALSSLATGLMQVTTTTGVITSVTNSTGFFALLDDETGTGGVVGANSPTFVDDISLASAGVKLTGAGGVLTILGLGTGADEDLSIDVNGTANTTVVTSSTGMNKITFTNITLDSTQVQVSGSGAGSVYFQDTDTNGTYTQLIGGNITANVTQTMNIANGTVAVYTNSSINKVPCWKTATTLGYCSDAINGTTFNCTCL